MFAAADCPPFYFGGETGAIAHGDAMGHNTDAIKATGSPTAAPNPHPSTLTAHPKPCPKPYPSPYP